MLKPFRPTRVHPTRDTRSNPERCVTCGKATRFGKERCIDHIHETAYAVRLVEEMERREVEVRKLNMGHYLDEDSHLVAEARAILWEKRVVTAPGLTRVMDLTHEQAERLFRSLSKHGIAEIFRNRRGVTAAKAVAPQDIEL